MILLKELREKRGLTQAQLSNSLKISPSAIGMYEQGRREPDHETLSKIADFFDVSIDYLIGRNKLIVENLSPERKRLIEEIRFVDDKTIEELQYFLDYLKSKNSRKGGS